MNVLAESITFPVPWLPMLIAFGVMGVGFGIRGIRNYSRERLVIEEAHEREETQRLFPSPWDEAYEECCETDGNPKSRIFLKGWLSKHENLPLLSSEAVCKLACELTFEYCDKWEECLNILALWDAERIVIEAAATDRKDAEKANNLKKKRALFSYPWDKVYDECRVMSFVGAQAWLRKWISEQDSLCSMSVEAADELLNHVAQEHDERKGFFGLLSPYLDTGCFDRYRNIADYSLRDELPQEWYDFWQEMKGYPARSSLFGRRTGWYSKEGTMVHPALKVPLTPNQAALLSRALGDGHKGSTEYYAEGLARCVFTGDEVPLVTMRSKPGVAAETVGEINEKYRRPPDNTDRIDTSGPPPGLKNDL